MSYVVENAVHVFYYVYQPLFTFGFIFSSDIAQLLFFFILFVLFFK